MIEQLLNELHTLWVLGFVTYPFVVALATSVIINLVFAHKYFSFKEGYVFMYKNFTKNQDAYSKLCCENAKLEDEIKKLKSNVKGKEKK